MWLTHVIRMPPEPFRWRFFWACPTVWSPEDRPRDSWRDDLSPRAVEHLKIHPETLEDAAAWGEGRLTAWLKVSVEEKREREIQLIQERTGKLSSADFNPLKS